MSTFRRRSGFSRPVVWAALGVLALTVFFAGLGQGPFIDRDEGEYATVAQEMINRADYVIPHVNGRAYYEKPALFFWMLVGSFKVFGQNEAAGRLPSALCALALTALLGWFARRHGDELTARLTVLFSLTSFLVVTLARVALLDMPLTLWTTLTLILFYEGYVAGEGRGRRWFLGAWAAMGLGFLTKGPVGVAVPLMAVFPVVVLNRDLWRTLRRAEIPLGLLVFAAAAAPWYVLAFLREGRLFWEGFFISQNVTRFTEVLLGHGAPLWFYLPVLALLVWPWSFFAAPPLWRGLAGTRRAERAADPEAARDFFLAWWFVTGFLFFSAAATKQPNYILPCVPPILLLAARWWRDRLTAAKAGEREALAATVSAGLFGLVPVGFLLALGWILPRAWAEARAGINPDSFEYALAAQPPELGWGASATALLLAAAVLAGLYFHRRRRRGRVLTSLALGALIFLGGMWGAVLPEMMDYLQTPARALAWSVRAEMGPDDRLAAYGLYKPTLWFYTGRHIERVRSHENEKLRETLASEERVFMLSRLSLLPRLQEEPDFRLFRTEGGYVLGGNPAAAGETVR